jgi:sulfate adenylyltransferase subunit 1
MLAASETVLNTGVDELLAQDLRKELLRFTTAGSVDDGKSTLIGRLLHDSKAVYEDQLAWVKKSRVNRSGGSIDFSLLTDGLRAEREQGITIDVAYRYFSTARRKFIIADTPGHEQYTRNMATGASTADLAVILVDATQGVLPQTRRHAYIASLLGIPNAVAAINKMDLVACSESVFAKLAQDFAALADRVGIRFVQSIPISALRGDNVVEPSTRMPWYAGPTLLQHLETVRIWPPIEMEAVRFPIQYVIRPDAMFRGFAGRVASGVLHAGDEVLALPSRQRTTVESIVEFDVQREEAAAGESTLLKLRDEIDLSRGDLLVSPDSPPRVASRFSAMAVWLHSEPLRLNRTYLAKHLGRHVKIQAKSIRFRIDVHTLTEQPGDQLEMNGIAAVEFETHSALFFDAYAKNRTTGSFILIDPASNATVGAAMIQEQSPDGNPRDEAWIAALDLTATRVSSEARIQRHRHRPAIFCANELALAESLEQSLFERGFEALLLAGDTLHDQSLTATLSALWSAGIVVIFHAPAISQQQRQLLQSTAGQSFFQFSITEARERETALRQALRMAETLRVNTAWTKENKADQYA